MLMRVEYYPITYISAMWFRVLRNSSRFKLSGGGMPPTFHEPTNRLLLGGRKKEAEIWDIRYKFRYKNK